jgi:arylsulfatase A-like enzyme
VNVVVIVADQLRADHLGHEGVQPVRTPNIDALAASGVRFSRAFVANPVCMPNRATIMTGRWPSAHGLRTNGLPLDADARTFVRVLREAGWTTAAVGKLHLQPMGWPFEEFQLSEIKDAMPDLWQQAVERFGTDFVSWEDYERHAAGPVTLPPDYYGFDDVALTVGHGDRMSGNYVSWARERGWDPMTQAGAEASAEVFPAWRQVYESAVPAALHPTSYVMEQAVERLERYAETGEQFCLYVSFPDPHHPFAPPAEYWGRHDPKSLTMPATFDDDHGSSPDYIRRIVEQRGFPNEDPMMTWAPTEEQYRHALAAELGSIEFIDDSVGRILEALERLDLSDDTLVVLTADHGDVFGDHGLMLKHFTHYRGVVRVPLLIRGPGIASGERDGLVSSADIANTVLDLAGMPRIPGVQGVSLEPVLRGEPGPDRHALLVEEDQPFGLDGLSGPVRIRTVITDRLRLTEIAGHGITELYDLIADPHERVNLADEASAAALLAEGRAEMLAEVLRLIDDSTVPFHAA